MPLGAHLGELRRRVVICLIAAGLAFLACWLFRERLIGVLTWPHVRVMRAFELDPTLKFQSYLEPVVAQLKACALAALVAAAPVIIYQLWAFISPGLFHQERRKVIWLGAACVVCFFAGVCFGYFVFVPAALRYLLLLSGSATEPVLMIGAYLTTFFLLTLALGVVFQTPIVIYFLIRWRIVSPEGLQGARKGVILGAFVVGAFLTPPDPLTQIMMAVTFIILYDLGVVLAAPSRATLSVFLRFTGSIVLVAGALLAWFGYWPVADVEAVRGRVTAGPRLVKPGQSRSLRRGAVCSTGKEALAEISFGADETVLHLAPEGRFRVQGPRKGTLHVGKALVVSPPGTPSFTLHAGPGTAAVETGRAELETPGRDTITLTVFEGEVKVKTEGTTRRVTGGQSLTLHRGGRPVDVSRAEEQWEKMLQRQPRGK